MTGWIKLRHNLEDDPKITIIARWLVTNCPVLCPDTLKTCPDMPLTIAVGAVAKVWSKVSQHAVRDVRTHADAMLRFGDRAILETWAGIPGFLDAMAAVNWVREESEGLVFPGFAHFAELVRERSDGKPAMTEAERKRLQRERRKNAKMCPDNVPQNVRTNVTADKTRKDKKRDLVKGIDQTTSGNSQTVSREAWEELVHEFGRTIPPSSGSRKVVAQWAWLILAGEPINLAVRDGITATKAKAKKGPCSVMGYLTTVVRGNIGPDYDAIMARAPNRKNCTVHVPNGPETERIPDNGSDDE